MSARFTIDGSEELENGLKATCEAVKQGVERIVPRTRLQGVILGGGYGRGEGGVLRSRDGDLPYNDMEFYVLVSGPVALNDRRYRSALHHLGEELFPRAGVEVEFKVLSRERLRRSPVNMFYYDLAKGHRQISGNGDLLAQCGHLGDAASIPLHEATRLLMNRCTGLLLSNERLERTAFGREDADFVGRNLAKAELAFGDVVLAARGLYSWSCLERHQRLLNLDMEEEWMEPVRAHHARGVDFKLHPVMSGESREHLQARHTELSELGQKLWIWVESKRLGKPFGCVSDYLADHSDKCPETVAWKNLLLNFRTFGMAGLFGSKALRYPRERLFHSLAALLWIPSVADTPEWKVRLSSELGRDARDFSGWVAAYEELWRKFN